MAEIGATFKSGETAPVSGVYRYVRHVNPTACQVMPEERQIRLQAGEKFPPHTCLRWLIWRLVEIDHTSTPTPASAGENAAG